MAVILSLVGYGSKPIFFLFILVILSLVLNEYYVLRGCSPAHRYGGMSLGLVISSGFFFFGAVPVVAMVSGMVILICILFLIAFQEGDDPHVVLEIHVVGLLVITFLFAHVIWVRNLDHGHLWIFYLCAVVFAGDSCALYGGNIFGRNRLALRISPNKTVEGAIAGVVGSCLAGVLAAWFLMPNFKLISFFFLSIVLGIAAQAGDLWESALKRQANVKDSGRLLPGHGGFLDRVDSMLFSTPLLYYAALFHRGLL